MAEYNWPRGVLRPSNVLPPTLNERNMATNPAISGYTQVVSSGPPIWTARFGNIDIRTSQQRLAWKALAALLEGRRNIVIVPFCGGDQPKSIGADRTTVPHDDDTPHDDDAPYSQKANEVYLSASSSAGAISLTFNVVVAGTIEPGHYLSINDRLYIIRKTPTPTTVEIWPPLRAGVNAGDWVEFDNPTCRMRLASDQEMSVDFQRLRFASPSVNFIEDLT
jgi:hypothetical protein